MLMPVDRTHLLSAPHLVSSFNSSKITCLLKQLDSSRCRIFIKSPEPPRHLAYDHREPYHGIDYLVEAMDPTFVYERRARSSLPPPFIANPFLPLDVSIATTEQKRNRVRLSSHC